jgi:glycosyltransferase involved in cell wall biosynthesis
MSVQALEPQPSSNISQDRSLNEPWPVLFMVRELSIGGCERDLAKLAKHINRSRFSPHVGCFRDVGLRRAELEAVGIPVVRFPVRSFRSLSLCKALAMFRRYAKLHRIALVHTFDAPSNFFGALAARLAGIPSVASQLWFADTIDPTGWRLHLLGMRAAKAIVVNSKAVSNRIAHEQPALRDRIYVSYNGVETEIFHPGEMTRGRDSLVIGAVCALRPEKRLDLLLDAFARLRSSHRGIQLRIIGSGEMLSTLEQQRERLGLGADCIFEPATPDVAPRMRDIDIFVLCSDSESFPNALLEAMACGCCVVASRVGGVPELVVDGRSGLLFEPGDVNDLVAKIGLLLENGPLRRRLACEAARVAREEFSMETAVARMEELYTHVITG